jgi:hypothetical protein
VSDAPARPDDAIRRLFATLRLPGVRTVRSFVALDLANLRRAQTEDSEFSAAVLAVGREILLALRAPSEYGVPVSHELNGCRRSKFESHLSDESNLRLIFRPSKPDGIEIIAFGHRDFPDSVYFTARGRLKKRTIRFSPLDSFGPPPGLCEKPAADAGQCEEAEEGGPGKSDARSKS